MAPGENLRPAFFVEKPFALPDLAFLPDFAIFEGVVAEKRMGRSLTCQGR